MGNVELLEADIGRNCGHVADENPGGDVDNVHPPNMRLI